MRTRWLVAWMILLGLGMAWGQERAGKRGRPFKGEREGGPGRPRIATVQKVEGDVVALQNPMGETRTVTLDENVRIEEMIPVAPSSLAEGQRIWVFGKVHEQGDVLARRIMVLSEERTPIQPGRGGRHGAGDRPALIVGEVVSNPPLMMKRSDGGTIQVILEKGAKIHQPQPLSKDSLKPGCHVALQMKPGDGGGPELVAIVVLSEQEGERLRKRGAGPK